MNYTYKLHTGNIVSFATGISREERNKTVVCASPREFVRAIASEPHNRFPIITGLLIKGVGCTDIEYILEEFCLKVFSAEHSGHTTSFWKDVEMDKYYLCAYDYDDQDYDSAAVGYFQEVIMEGI